MNQIILALPLILVAICIFFAWQIRRYSKSLKESKRVFVVTGRINQILNENLDFKILAQKIADVIPNELSFGTGVLSIFDEKRGVLKRVAASKTTEAIEAIQLLEKMDIPFHGIEISIQDPNNLMAKAIRENKNFITNDSYDVLGPILDKAQAKQVQSIMHTNTTFVYPIFFQNRPLGVFITSTSKLPNQMSVFEMEIIKSFVSSIGFILQNSILFTSLSETTKKLQEANMKLQALDNLKDDFVSIASHELRTPMTVIRSYVWMALHKSDIPLSEKLKRYLYRTLISTERLINLVNDMLNVSRIEAGSIEIFPKPMDIVSLVKDVMEEVKIKADEKMIKLQVMEEKLPPVFADVDKVHEVLLNLIGNSLKFTPPDGVITVGFFADGQMIDISVKDNGCGMSKEDISKLFHKFSRLDNSYVAIGTSGGTGLGLYISKSLIDMMHGRVWATSEGIGKGTMVSFSLPIATQSLVQRSEKFHIKPTGEAKVLEPPVI